VPVERPISSDETAQAGRHRRRCKIISMTVPGKPDRLHTHRLDLEDPSIRECAATVLLADADQGIVPDRSAAEAVHDRSWRSCRGLRSILIFFQSLAS
jgi:hypothetical protein